MGETTFEVGDRVRVIECGTDLPLGHVFTVTKGRYGFPVVVDRGGDARPVCSGLFEKVGAFEIVGSVEVIGPPGHTDLTVPPEDLEGIECPNDPVFRPYHYARFVIEPATFIAANGLPFLVGNAIKYACRYDAKGRPVEDLNKAIRCLEMQREVMMREERISAGESPEDVWKEVL